MRGMDEVGLRPPHPQLAFRFDDQTYTLIIAPPKGGAMKEPSRLRTTKNPQHRSQGQKLPPGLEKGYSPHPRFRAALAFPGFTSASYAPTGAFPSGYGLYAVPKDVA